MNDNQNAPPAPASRTVRIVNSCEEKLPLIVLVMLVLFIIVSSISAYHIAVISEDHGERDGGYTIWPFVVFVALSLAYSAWFISCFTGEVSPDKKRQSFRFAYAFTITAFVVLMIPVANPWQPDVVGPISLVRGCVLAPAGNESSIPGAIRCVRSETNYLPPEVRLNYAQPAPAKAATPASDTAASGAAAVDAASGAQGGSQPAAGSSKPQYAPCDKKNIVWGPCIEGFSYPWLVTLGGFNGVVIEENRPLAEKDATAEHASSPSASADPKGPRWFATRGSIVQGGFVVPFYVVLLALVGGAVSLARRIPEYQKRSGEHYVPTLKQSALKDLEVREVVVFQIMQLVSAPFIAVVAFYAIAPDTMSSAIGLAFLSGFSSELILLQVRGVIEGLQPHSTSPANPANKPDPSVGKAATDTSTQPSTSSTPKESLPGAAASNSDTSATGYAVTGMVVDAAGEPISGAMIQSVNSKISATSGDDGHFSLANVPSGEDHLTISKGDQQGSQDVTVSGAPVDLGHITLGAGGAG